MYEDDPNSPYWTDPNTGLMIAKAPFGGQPPAGLSLDEAQAKYAPEPLPEPAPVGPLPQVAPEPPSLPQSPEGVPLDGPKAESLPPAPVPQAGAPELPAPPPEPPPPPPPPTPEQALADPGGLTLGDIRQKTATGAAEEYAGQRDAVGVEAEAASEVSGLLDALNSSTQLLRERQDIIRRDAEEDRRRLLAEREAARKEAEGWSPKTLWGSMDGGGKAIYLIGAALSSIGEALSGGTGGRTVQLIQGMIDRHISAQKREYERLRNKVKGVDNAYAAFRKRVGDDEMAMALTEEAMLKDFVRQTENIMRKATTEKAKAQLQTLHGQLMQRLGQSDFAINRAAQSDTIRAQQLAAKLSSGRRRDDADPVTKASAMKRWGLNPKDANRSFFVQGFDHPPISFGSTGAKEEFVDRFNTAEGATRIIDELIDMRKKHGFESDIWNSTEGQVMKNKYTNLLMSMKDTWQLGALSGDDITLVENALGGDPTAFKDMLGKLVSQRDIIEKGVRTELKNRYRDQRGDTYRGWSEFHFPKYTAAGTQQLSEDQARGIITRRYIPGVGVASKGDAITEIKQKYEEKRLEDPAGAKKFLDVTGKALQAEGAKYAAEIRKLSAKKKRTPEEEKTLSDLKKARADAIKLWGFTKVYGRRAGKKVKERKERKEYEAGMADKAAKQSEKEAGAPKAGPGGYLY